MPSRAHSPVRSSIRPFRLRASDAPSLVLLVLAFLLAPAASTGVSLEAQAPLKVFISVDMEGIGGIGTGAMASSGGKDYATGRRLMTDEVNTVVEEIFRRGPAEIVVNDSHGDMQNLLHTELDPRITYIQGAIKPLGMVEGLDGTFDAAIFLGYHARAGTPSGFLAHTGSGIVKGLWLNDLEVGEGELNAAFAGAHGVPVVLAAGDSVFVEQFGGNVPSAEMVTTKYAVTPQSARLLHPEVVRERLRTAAAQALDNGLASAEPLRIGAPVRIRLQFGDVTRPQILLAIPGVRQVDGYTVEVTAEDMTAAYRLIRLMYRFVSI